MPRFTARLTTLLLGMTALAGSAHAEFYPYYSGNHGTLPSNVVPQRFYRDPYAAASTPAPTYTAPQQAAPAYSAPAAAPTVYAQPAPAPVAYVQPPAPQVIAPPIYTPPAQAYAAPVYTPPAPAPQVIAAPAPTYTPVENPGALAAATSDAPVYVAPASAVAATPSYPQDWSSPTPPAPTYQPANTSTPYVPPNMPVARSAPKTNRFSIGGDAYYDNYREPTATVNTHSYFGGIDGSWTHYFSNTAFSTLEGRADLGSGRYKSSSGSETGDTQREYEVRALAGADIASDRDRHWKPYTGLGLRYYDDHNKGGMTNLGFSGYERRIFQMYAPFGLTYDFPVGSWTLSPNLEFDTLLFGNVSSRLQNLPGYTPHDSAQDIFSGYGIRAEMGFSKLNSNGTGWEIAPYMRYWNMQDSELDLVYDPSIPGPAYFLEPQNNRLQLGAKVKYLF